MKLQEVKRLVEQLFRDFENRLAKRQPKRPQEDRRALLYFQQADGDMPDNGDDFPKTYAPNRTYQIFGYLVNAEAGTYSVQLKLNGSLVGPTITQATAGENTAFTTPVKWIAGEPATVKVNSSDSCEEFEICFLMREI